MTVTYVSHTGGVDVGLVINVLLYVIGSLEAYKPCWFPFPETA